MIRENIALISSLIESRVGTVIQLGQKGEMTFTLTKEIKALFSDLPEDIKIKNGNGNHHELPTAEEIQQRRHDAVRWLQPIYELYKNSEYKHPNESVDMLITVMYEMDESVMGNHLIPFLLSEPRKKVQAKRYQDPTLDVRWIAPREMVRNIEARAAQETTTREEQTFEPVVIFEEDAQQDDTEQMLLVSEETQTVISDTGESIDVSDYMGGDSVSEYALDDHTEKENPIEQRDPEVREKLQEDLEKVVASVRTSQATTLQISAGLGIHVHIVNKIAEAFKLKKVGKKERYNLYDRVGMMLIEYGRETFGKRSRSTYRPNEIEALKHMAIEIHTAWEEEQAKLQEDSQS